MALHSNQVTIKSEPTELYPIDLDGVELTIQASADIYLGSDTLSEKTGFLLPKASILSLSLGPGEHIYGLCVDDAATVYVLATKNG